MVGGIYPGEKAGFLQEYQQLAREVGLIIPPTVVLAKELLEPTRENIVSCDSTRVDEIAAKAIGLFVTSKLSPFTVVRSSASADGRGTGVYSSIPTETRWSEIHSAVIEVLRSADTDGARVFREQVAAVDNMAVMLQPMVGQWSDRRKYYNSFAPILSGTAYSSTSREKDGIINVVPGFGGGVTEGGALQLTSAVVGNTRISREYRLSRWNNEEKLVRLRDVISAQSDSSIRSGKRNAFFDPRSILYSSGARGHAYYQGEGIIGSSFDEQYTDYGEGKNGIITISSDTEYPEVTTSFGHGMARFSPERFFEMLSALENKAGVPLYLEWAMTMRDEEKPDFWLVQIAPVLHKDLPTHEQVDFRKTYYQASGVIGSGIRKAAKIVVLNNPGDVEQLNVYNADPANEGYVLVYTSRLTTSIARGFKKLSWEDCSRASVLLEWQDAGHSRGTPIDHIQGVTDVTGKIFGVINWEKMRHLEGKNLDQDEYLEWRSPDVIGSSEYSCLNILEDDITVVADEQSDILTVGRAINK